MAGRTPRGSSLTRTLREDSVLHILDSGGPHICVPWTGPDWHLSKDPCPGFKWSGSRGLLCYVIPEIMLYELRQIFRGIFDEDSIGKVKDWSSESIAIGITGSTQPGALNRGNVEDTKARLQDLLEQAVRLVKISGYPETEWRYLPNNSDYKVAIIGPYHAAQFGTLVAKTSKGREDTRFLQSMGTAPWRDVGTGSGAIAAVREFDAASPTNRVAAGYPVRGEPPRMRLGVEGKLAVYSEPAGVPPALADLSKVVNVDADFKA